MKKGRRKPKYDDSYGFDSSTVGSMDLGNKKSNPSKLLLAMDDAIDEADNQAISEISNIRVQDMSPKSQFEHEDNLSDEYDHDHDVDGFSQDGFLENLSGSSSDEEDDDNSNLNTNTKSTVDDDHQLTRVKKHNSKQ